MSRVTSICCIVTIHVVQPTYQQWSLHAIVDVCVYCTCVIPWTKQRWPMAIGTYPHPNVKFPTNPIFLSLKRSSKNWIFGTKFPLKQIPPSQTGLYEKTYLICLNYPVEDAFKKQPLVSRIPRTIIKNMSYDRRHIRGRLDKLFYRLVQSVDKLQPL